MRSGARLLPSLRGGLPAAQVPALQRQVASPTPRDDPAWKPFAPAGVGHAGKSGLDLTGGGTACAAGGRWNYGDTRGGETVHLIPDLGRVEEAPLTPQI